MSKQIVSIGPTTVEVYGPSAWTRLPAGIKSEDLWQLVGPTVDKHLRSNPLWKVFCIVYFEGLAHGQAAEQERQRKEDE